MHQADAKTSGISLIEIKTHTFYGYNRAASIRVVLAAL
jgi:hypothetical protein